MEKDSTYRGESGRCSLLRYTLLYAIPVFLLIIGPKIHAAQISLEWDAPVVRTDGSPLQAPLIYRLYYGTASGHYDHVVEAGSDCSVLIEGLSERVTYYFIVTAMDDLELESPPSEEIEWNSFTADYPGISSWLIQHGISDRAEDILEEDLDGDGLAVWQEYLMDSDPTDPDSNLHLISMTPIHGDPRDIVWTNSEPPYEVRTQSVSSVIGFSMTWRCSTNRIYDVQYSSDLAKNEWAPMEGMTDLVPVSEDLVVTNMIGDEPMKMVRLVVRHP